MFLQQHRFVHKEAYNAAPGAGKFVKMQVAARQPGMGRTR